MIILQPTEFRRIITNYNKDSLTKLYPVIHLLDLACTLVFLSLSLHSQECCWVRLTELPPYLADQPLYQAKFLIPHHIQVIHEHLGLPLARSFLILFS